MQYNYGQNITSPKYKLIDIPTVFKNKIELCAKKLTIFPDPYNEDKHSFYPGTLKSENHPDISLETQNISEYITELIYKNTSIKLLEPYCFQYVKYDVDEFYELEEHADDCFFTAIIYIYKDESIIDDFWVGDEKIKDRWVRNKILLMWGGTKCGPMHRGVLTGSGNKEIAIMFFNKKN